MHLKQATSPVLVFPHWFPFCWLHPHLRVSASLCTSLLFSLKIHTDREFLALPPHTFCLPVPLVTVLLFQPWGGPLLSPFPFVQCFSHSQPCSSGSGAAPAPRAAAQPAHSEPLRSAAGSPCLCGTPDVPPAEVTGWWHKVWSLCIPRSTGKSVLTHGLSLLVTRSWNCSGLFPADPLYLPNAPNHAI